MSRHDNERDKKNDTKRRVEWRTKKQRLAMYQCENTNAHRCVHISLIVFFPHENLTIILRWNANYLCANVKRGGKKGRAVTQTSNFPRSAKGHNFGHVWWLTMRICRRSSDVVHVVCRAPLDCIISRCISAGLSLWVSCCGFKWTHNVVCDTSFYWIYANN